MPFIRQAIDKRGVFVQRINPASNDTYLDIEAAESSLQGNISFLLNEAATTYRQMKLIDHFCLKEGFQYVEKMRHRCSGIHSKVESICKIPADVVECELAKYQQPDCLFLLAERHRHRQQC